MVRLGRGPKGTSPDVAHVAALRHGVDPWPPSPLGVPAGPWSAGLTRRAVRPESAFDRRGSSFKYTASSGSTRGGPGRSVASWWAASWSASARGRCSPCEAWVRERGVRPGSGPASSRWGPTVETPRSDVPDPGRHPAPGGRGQLQDRTSVSPTSVGDARPAEHCSRPPRGPAAADQEPPGHHRASSPPFVESGIPHVEGGRRVRRRGDCRRCAAGRHAGVRPPRPPRPPGRPSGRRRPASRRGTGGGRPGRPARHRCPRARRP